MKRRTLAVAALSLAVAVASSCGVDDSDSSATADDGGANDAGRTRESGASDSSDDAPGTVNEWPFPGTWKPLPGHGSDCNLVIPSDPSVLASKWIPCASAKAGCRLLDTPWASIPGQKLDYRRRPEPARLVGTTAYLRMRLLATAPPPLLFHGRLDVIEPLDGQPVAALGSRRVQVDKQSRICTMDAWVGDYGVVFKADLRDFFDAGPIYPPLGPRILIGWAPWPTPNAFSTKITQRTDWYPPGGLNFTGGAVGSSKLWLDTLSPESTAFFDVSTQTIGLHQGFMTGQINEHVLPVPGGALVFDAATPFSIFFLSDQLAMTRLVTPTSPQSVTWKAIDRSAGHAIVWVESDTDTFDYTNSTLWTAPFATSEANIVRRKVAKLDDLLHRGGADGVANRGVFLSLVGRNRALVTRLSDGLGWFVDGEPGTRMVAPLWVDDNDVLIETAPDPNPPAVEDPTTILRISRAVLGAPTVPSGI